MVLKSLVLHNFRSYQQNAFAFDPKVTYIVGPNTAGKTNLVEAIYLLATGKGFRADKEHDLIFFGQKLAKVQATLYSLDVQTKLEVVFIGQEEREAPIKKFLVNGVSKRRIDFIQHFNAVLFSPLDLDIVSGSPSLRRGFLNDILEQVDHEYRFALSTYEKALRQRNALLDQARDQGGLRNEKQFDYWDTVLIENGQLITHKRNALIAFLNDCSKEVFDFLITYDKSEISKERLLQYREAEIGAGVTLVGPHRDDFGIAYFDQSLNAAHDIKQFGSRGQQRLVILQLKMLALDYIEKKTLTRPLLLLDDIFSELDERHIRHVIELIGKQQTIVTTTHQEFIGSQAQTRASVVELKIKNNGNV